MSFSAPDPLSLAGLNTGLPSINQADIPASVRNGNTQAKNAYTEGLEFEQVLVQQLAQQLSNTVSDAGSDSSDSSDSSGAGDSGDAGSSTGLLGSGSPASGYSSLISQALTDSIMSGGGLGVAQEIAQAIDPSMNDTGSTKS
jgi:Rod binding domain-containing protein